jgi:predicted MFS family arabinose efflux permease
LQAGDCRPVENTLASGAVLGGMVVNGRGVSSAMLFGGTLMVVATVIVLSGLVLGRIGQPTAAA